MSFSDHVGQTVHRVAMESPAEEQSSMTLPNSTDEEAMTYAAFQVAYGQAVATVSEVQVPADYPMTAVTYRYVGSVTRNLARQR
jgi:hypothetical protein